MLPAAAPVDNPVPPPRPPALYALAGASLFVHAAAALVLILGVLFGEVLVGLLIAIVTLGIVNEPLRQSLNTLQHADALFDLMLLCVALKPLAIVLTILALRRVRWAQIALSVALGLLFATDLVCALIVLFSATPQIPGGLALFAVAAGQGFLLFSLEGKRRS